MSEKNTDDKRPSISRRNAIKAAGTLGTGGLILSGLGTSAIAVPDNEPDPGPDENASEIAKANWRDVDWEHTPDQAQAPDPEDVDEAEVTEAMGDPDNWELHFHDDDELENVEQYVGKNRNADPSSSISTMATWTYNIGCWNPPFIEEGCLDVRATASWNRVDFSLNLWDYTLWSKGVEWVPNGFTVSFNFTWKGVRFSGSVSITLEHQIGDDWEVCIGAEACVISESWCVSPSICFTIYEP